MLSRWFTFIYVAIERHSHARKLTQNGRFARRQAQLLTINHLGKLIVNLLLRLLGKEKRRVRIRSGQLRVT